MPQARNRFRGIATSQKICVAPFTMNAAQILRIYDPGPNRGSYYFLLPGSSPAANRLAAQIARNRAPAALCQNKTVSANTSCEASASVDNGSYDPDGDPVTVTQSPPGPYSLGVTDVTLTVRDPQGETSTCTATVTVVDTTTPKISPVSATPNSLWPPNHRLMPVTIAASATDNCDPNAGCRIVSVSSNEQGTQPEWQITGPLTVNLRSERSGSGSGRVYTITVRCTDRSGNSSTKPVTVSVPHDQGKK
jgi:hypothetical protein